MKKTILTFLITTCLLIITNNKAFAERINLPKDAEGWTIFTPSSDSRIVYVNSQSGNDDTCQYYSPSDVNIGNTPFDPNGTITACKTIGKAIQLTRDGYPDWILLRKGQVHRYNIKNRELHYGRSSTEPFLISSYGPESEYASWRPINFETDPNKIGTPDENRSNYLIDMEAGYGRQLNYLAFVNLEFYADYLDPDSPNWLGNDGIDPEGVSNNTMVGKMGTIRVYGDYKIGLFFEGCRFKQVKLNLQTAKEKGNQDWTFRRNFFDRSNNGAGEIQGTAYNFLIEENVFYHNGWYDDTFPAQESGDRIRDHALYLSPSGDNFIERENTIIRPCSQGFKHRAQYTPLSTDHVEITDNLIVDANIPFSLNHEEAAPFTPLPAINIEDNVIVHSGETNSNHQNMVWQVPIISNLTLKHNIFAYPRVFDNTAQINIAHTPNDPVNPSVIENVDVNNNIFYSPGQYSRVSGNIDVSGAVELKNAIFANNIFYENVSKLTDFMKYYSAYGGNDLTIDNVTFSGNTYYSPNTFLFQYPGPNAITMTQDEWKLQYDQTASFAEPIFPDSNRNIITYLQHLGRGNSLEDYYNQIRQIGRYNWDTDLMAEKINPWIRAGYFVDNNYNGNTRADVNQDNQITSTDAMLTLRKSLNLDMSQTNWQDSPTTGDVNCDNTVNFTDAMLILRKSLNLDMTNTDWCVN